MIKYIFLSVSLLANYMVRYVASEGDWLQPVTHRYDVLSIRASALFQLNQCSTIYLQSSFAHLFTLVLAVATLDLAPCRPPNPKTYYYY
jgi:hypothetical protein